MNHRRPYRGNDEAHSKEKKSTAMSVTGVCVCVLVVQMMRNQQPDAING